MAFSYDALLLNIPGDVLVKLITVHLNKSSCVRQHSHYTLELSTILSGRGEYRVGNEVYPVSTGDIVLFNNTEKHGLWNVGDEDVINLALEFEPRFICSNPGNSFDISFLALFFDRNDNFKHKLDCNNPIFPTLQRQFLEIKKEFEQHLPKYEVVIKAKLLNILADLLRHYDITNTVSTSHAFINNSANVNQALEFIAKHYKEDISLKTLSDLLHMNQSYFSKVFRLINGIGAKEYIVKMRISEAAQLLKSTSDSVLDIAESCGFNSLSNFYSAFKRGMGKSPVQYRLSPLDK